MMNRSPPGRRCCVAPLLLVAVAAIAVQGTAALTCYSGYCSPSDTAAVCTAKVTSVTASAGHKCFAEVIDCRNYPAANDSMPENRCTNAERAEAQPYKWYYSSQFVSAQYEAQWLAYSIGGVICNTDNCNMVNNPNACAGAAGTGTIVATPTQPSTCEAPRLNGTLACLAASKLVVNADCTVKFSSAYDGCSKTTGKGFITDMTKAVAIYKADDFECLDSNGKVAACTGAVNDNTTDAYFKASLNASDAVIQYDKNTKTMIFKSWYSYVSKPEVKGCIFDLVSGKILGEDVVSSPPAVSNATASADKIKSTVRVSASFTLPDGKDLATFINDIKRAVLGNLLSKYYKDYRGYLDSSGALILDYVKVSLTQVGRRRLLGTAVSGYIDAPIPAGADATVISTYVKDNAKDILAGTGATITEAKSDGVVNSTTKNSAGQQLPSAAMLLFSAAAVFLLRGAL